MTTPMLFERQKRLLVLLDAVGGRVGNLDFQKLLFLYCQEVGSSPPYEFVPYKFGAFSFTSYADRRKLIEHDLLQDDEQTWQMTARARTMVRGMRGVRDLLRAFVERYRGLTGDALVAETYRRYPYFATRSEIADRILRGDAAALKRIDAARRTSKAGPVSTIGYEGHTIESYLNRLIRANVSLLCDVRRNPISRKYGFSKSTLARACEGVSIRYEHVPELGIASEKRQTLNTQTDYDALFREYERDELPHQRPALEKLRQWVERGERIALTCYERLPQQCHRHCIAEALVEEFGANFIAVNL